MLRSTSKFLVLSAPLLLGACGSLGIGESEFGCAGMPQGVSCLSARQVYEETNNRDHLSGADLAREMEAGRQAASVAPTSRPRTASDIGGMPVGYAAMPVAHTDDGRVPIRTPAVVMKVWVAPYSDGNGDLHMPGFVFTEIEPRKWQVGMPDTSAANSHVFQPLSAQPVNTPSVQNRPAAPAPSATPARSDRSASTTTTSNLTTVSSLEKQ
ncbi:type IV conjugative transfer system lipoprotein TraV [Azospirillum sp. SYSU D00513]|uniref:type IV conjugative transfer system lipoprotein TraV n=1 Tax=Azospirillum sp. SYSU D00513 TaxID=2812561 RepID=UPI001A977B4E|nr:type IV conjugative transfer system lipoprotein TraV [Azospirillum sp. SYSU D00513]